MDEKARKSPWAGLAAFDAAERLEFLERVLDVVPDVIGVQDRDRRILLYNAAGYDFLGITPDEAAGRCCFELIGRDCPCTECATSRCFLSKKTEKIEKFLPERELWLECKSYPILGNDGEIRYVVEHLADITERKRAEAELREGKATLQSIFRAAPVGIGLVSNRLLLQVNDRVCAMTGYDREEMLGRDARFLYPSDEEYAFVGREKYAQIAACGTGTVRTQWRRKDGAIIHVLLSSSPLDPDDLSAGVTFTALDITDRVRGEEEHARLEAQLRHAQKMEAVGRLAGGVAHDFNNMLAVIVGNAELALARLEPSDPLAAELREIKTAGDRSAELTRQLLAFARRQAITPRRLDLNTTIESMLKMLRRLIGEDIDLAWRPGTDLWPVRMDPAQIDQVLANLAVNARDAISGVGRLTIETGNRDYGEAFCRDNPGSPPGEWVMLSFRDDGCGMDPETIGHLFEPFFTTKKAGKGTGLGLATVYGIVQQNGGFISVTSEPGQGSDFRILLPRSRESDGVPDAGPAPPNAEGGTETVLLVEDEPSLLNLCRNLMTKLGYTVLGAGGPGEAIRLAGEHPGPIHLLMTDVVMPGMDGHALHERLREERPGLRCLYMSGYTADIITLHGVLGEGVYFLQKPFTRQALADKLRTVLGPG
ncbi:MAG: PAS domain S-box protein [Acidobacteria bacterium]|nr:PAS domain S-box protein [Acidobacteriota bacterium]